MLWVRFVWTVLAIVFCFGPSSILAKKYASPFVWEPISETDWAVTADSAQKIHDAAMLFEKVYMDDLKLEDKKCYRTLYRRVRILTDAGREWADVEVPFFHRDQRIEQILGRTILRDGTVIALTEDQIFEKEVVKSKEFKYKQTTFSLPGVSDDCIVEYIIVCRAPYTYREWYIQKSIPLLSFSYHWKLAEMTMTYALQEYLASHPTSDFTIPNYLWLNPTSRQNITQLPNVKEPKELLMETVKVPPFEEEPFDMPENSLKERLLCYYGSKITSAAYWGASAANIMENSVEFCEKNKRVRKIVEPLKDLATEDQRIRAAYDWVQDNITNITYVDLYDKKDSTKKIKPKKRKSVDDVIKLGYGTSTNINRLFWDMLRELNIDAKFGYAKDRFDDLFVAKAKYWQFDRSFVAIPNSAFGYQFCSPGLPRTPSHLIPWYLEGVTALMTDADEYLVTIPFSTAEVSTARSVIKYGFGDNLAPEGHLEVQLQGHLGRTYRVKLLNEALTDHQEILEEAFTDLYPEAEFDTICYEMLDSVKLPFRLSSTLKFPPVSPMGGRLLLKPADYLTLAENDFVSLERTGSVLFRHAFKSTEAAEFTLPEGWRVEALPDDTVFSNKAGQVGVQFVAVGEDFSMLRSFTLNAPYWLVEDYPLVRRLFQARQEMSERMVVLTRTAGDSTE